VVLGRRPSVVPRHGERPVGVVQRRRRAVSGLLGQTEIAGGPVGSATSRGFSDSQSLKPLSFPSGLFVLDLSLAVPWLRTGRRRAG